MEFDVRVIYNLCQACKNSLRYRKCSDFTLDKVNLAISYNPRKRSRTLSHLLGELLRFEVQ